MLQHYNHTEPFTTECGAALNLSIAYTNYGTLNTAKTNVVWVCHALTANAMVADWWPGFVGEGCVINPKEHFIVCANIIGSCYGTVATPVADNNSSPLITIRDMVAAHILLRKHLGIEQIALLVGGSMGGYQAMEWAIIEPAVPQRLLLLTTSAAESAWGIAIHEAQRMAIEADNSWQDSTEHAGEAGLKAARAIGMLTYRNYAQFSGQQGEVELNKLDGFRAASYQRYQGEKLAKRFNARNYWHLTKSMDTHNIARNRTSSIHDALKLITQPTLVIGINSDLLCPLTEQQQLAAYIPNATLVEIDSPFGHDGFLVEVGIISRELRNWLEDVNGN